MGTTAPSWVGISALTISDEYQMREKISASIVTEYTELIQASESQWPFASPCSVVRVGEKLILVDGFHRVAAMKKAGEDQVSAVITDGTKTDALKAAIAANGTHGLRLSNADKRRKVTVALSDPTLKKWSDNKLAELCCVSVPFVGSVRGELLTVNSSPPSGPQKNTSSDGATRPATKADAEMQRQKIVATLLTEGELSDRTIAQMVGCDHKTVGKVRRELAVEDEPVNSDPEPEDEPVEDPVEDLPDEPRDLLDMFEDMKQLIRDAMHEFPVNQRSKIWPQLIEQLSQEDLEQW